MFRGYELVSAPPPSSGGIHVSQILTLLEPFPLKQLGHNSAGYLHVLIEAMKLAYADRSEYLGDPDRTAIPMTELTSEAYLECTAGHNQKRSSDATQVIFAPALLTTRRAQKPHITP